MEWSDVRRGRGTFEVMVVVVTMRRECAMRHVFELAKGVRTRA